MPCSTTEFPFEECVFRFAYEHSNRHRNATRPFLLLVDSQGKVISTEFRGLDASTQYLSNPHALLDDEQRFNGCLFYDPFDWPEYAWLAWSSIDRATMERLIGVVFNETAFRSASGKTIPFPATWSVMA